MSEAECIFVHHDQGVRPTACSVPLPAYVNKTFVCHADYGRSRQQEVGSSALVAEAAVQLNGMSS